MKKIILFLVFTIVSTYTFAQNVAQFDEKTLDATPIIDVEKGDILKNVNMIANMRFASNSNFANSKFVNSAFKANELRMELVGNVTKNIKFRLRDRFAGNAADALTSDGLRHAVDLAYVEYAVTPQLSITGGKMLSEWGSYELDMNPVYMYAYNDLSWYGDFFLSGVKASYAATPDHTFSLQVINSNSRSFEQIYGNVPGVEAARAPIGATINWRGNFANKMLSTMWSYSLYNQAKNQHWNMIALGNQLRLPNLTLQYDFKYTNDDLDNLGVVSNLVASQLAKDQYRVQDVRYIENWIRGEYFFDPRWSTTITGMVNSNYWDGNPDHSAARTDRLSTTWGFIAALEYHIFKPYNVKLFAAYVGRYTNYTDYAKTTFNFEKGNSGQVLIGIVSPLVLF